MGTDSREANASSALRSQIDEAVAAGNRLPTANFYRRHWRRRYRAYPPDVICRRESRATVPFGEHRCEQAHSLFAAGGSVMSSTSLCGADEVRQGNLQPKAELRSDLFNGYERENFFDEMIDETGEVLAHYRKFDALFRKLSAREFEKKERSV